jgi:hypothetical protein
MMRPKTGKARLRWVNGKVSAWVKATDIEATAGGVSYLLARDDDQALAALEVPALSVAYIEYVTDEEHKALMDEETKKAKAKAREIP